MIREFQGEKRFLSNFPDAEVMWGGIKFPRVENAYQAAKCRDIDLMTEDFINHFGK